MFSIELIDNCLAYCISRGWNGLRAVDVDVTGRTLGLVAEIKGRRLCVYSRSGNRANERA